MTLAQMLMAQAAILFVVALVVAIAAGLAGEDRRKTQGRILASIGWLVFAAAAGSALVSVWLGGPA